MRPCGSNACDSWINRVQPGLGRGHWNQDFTIFLFVAGYAVSASLLEGTISDSNGPLLYYADIPDPQVIC